MLQLYKNIKNRRIDLKMTQGELADLTGYAGKSIIARIEHGQIDLPQSKIVAFAAALHTTPAALMGWDTDTAVAPDQLRQDEVKLLGLYNELNELGQNKVIEDTEDLTHLPKYTEREKMRNA